MTNTIPEESAKMEEGIIDEAIPSTESGNKRLSTVSKMYDLNGDGKLDEAELAMRNMDKSGRGHLTNEKVYNLMQEQLSMQKSLFQMKKVIAGLLVFVVILALSNLGTSFASAILAKDTTTNSSSGSPELVDKKTGETIATDQAIERFTSEVLQDDLFNRGLAGGTVTYASASSRMLKSEARAMLRKCRRGNKIVKLTAVWDGLSAERTVCHNSWSCVNRFDDSLQWGVLCLQGTDPLEYVYINRDESDPDYYIISSTDPDAITTTTTTTTTTTQAATTTTQEATTTTTTTQVATTTKAEDTTQAATTVASTLAEYQKCSLIEGSPSCDDGLECVAEITPSLEISRVAATKCGASTSSTGITSTGSTPSTGGDCSSESDSGPICYNDMCGTCDLTTCVAGSSTPTCVTEDGMASYCGCISGNDCGTGETCGVPSCVADITKYCSADKIDGSAGHDRDWGCDQFADDQLTDQTTVSLTCKVPTPVLGEYQTCSFEEGSPSCDASQGLECVAEATFESGGLPVAPVFCGATTTTTSTGTASTDSPVFTSYSEDCSNSESGDICHNNVCGFCDDSTCDANSNRPNCISEDGRASYCGCTSDNECGPNESCGVPSCVADITNYCSAGHDVDYGCDLVNLANGETVSLTCKVPPTTTTTLPTKPPLCGSVDPCTSTLPDGVACIESSTESIEEGCGSDGIKYCNSCVAVANGAEWVATVTTVPPK